MGVGIEPIDKASFVYTSQLMYHHSVASPGTGHFCFNPKADISPPVNSPSYIPPTNDLAPLAAVWQLRDGQSELWGEFSSMKWSLAAD